MRLVQYDVIREKWRAYDIDSIVIDTVGHHAPNDVSTTMREPKVWRYAYELWTNKRREMYQGITAIAHNDAAARRMVRDFMREEMWQDVH